MPKILVVDDMSIFREPIAMCLRGAGFETLTASDGQEAWAVLQAHRPDLLLLDLAMPVMDGIALLGVMRNDPTTRQLPVILLTATSDKDLIVQAAKLGIKDYLLKTQFSLKDLLERVRRHVGEPLPQTISLASVAATKEEAPPDTGPAASSGPSKPLALLVALGLQTSGRAQPTSAAAAVPTPVPAAQSRRPLALPDLPHLMTRETCVARIANGLQTKALAGVIAPVIGLAASPRGDAKEMAGMIMRDPILSARVLQVANSAAYVSNSGQAFTIQEAVRRLGCVTIRNIAVALGAFDVMPDCTIAGFDPIRQWQHALGVATLCEHLVADDTALSNGTAYLTGLFHDLGEVLFYRHFAKEYQQVLECQTRTEGSPREVEKAMLGATREELSLLLLESAGLPEAVQYAVALFHRSATAGSGDGQKLARVLRLADVYANGLLLAAGPHSLIQGLTCAECHAATGQDHPAVPNGALLRSEVLAVTGMLLPQRTGRGPDAAMPLYPRRNIQLLLVRAPGLSTFDPVQAALESFASVTGASALPHGVTPWDALVVVAPSSTSKGFTAVEIEQCMATGRHSPFPLLWLVGGPHHRASEPKEALEPTAWPMTLEQLAAFIQSASSKQASTMSAA